MSTIRLEKYLCSVHSEYRDCYSAVSSRTEFLFAFYYADRPLCMCIV